VNDENTMRVAGTGIFRSIIYANENQPYSAIEQAKAAGFRTVAVYGSTGAADWDAMQKEADQAILHYGEFFAQMA
jgi:tRNA G18 (ribose-2'-O)-methylase SpoU